MALLREFGWSRSLVAGAFSVFALVHGLSSAPIGWLADRRGPRRVVAAGGLVLVAGLLLDGAVTSPWQLYAAFGLVTSIGVAAAGWVPAVVLVQRWFPRRVGLALGITSAGIGMGIFLVVPLCQWLISAVGWRWAFRVVAGLAALWIVPTALLVLRDPPRPAALPESPAPRRAAAAGAGDITLRDALASGRFWLLAVAQVLGNFACQMLLVHQAAYLVDQGVATMMAASVVSVVGLASIVGKAGGGWFSDSFGRELTYSLGMLCVVTSVGVLGLVALGPSVLLVYAYGVLVGVGYSVTAPLMPAVISDLFRGPHFGAIFGALHLGNALGGSLGPWAAGRIFDATGSYRLAFIGAIAGAILGTLGLWIAGPRRGPLRR